MTPAEAPSGVPAGVTSPPPPPHGSAPPRAIEATGLVKRYRPDLTFPRLLATPFRLLWNLARRAFGASPRRPELDGFSCAVPAGAVVGFLGPNGAGKTTAMKIVANLLCADSGFATIHGEPVVERYDHALRRLGCMVGEPHLYPYLTGRQNLRIAGYFHAGIDDARIEATLAQVGMGHAADKRFGEYSSGMKKRLALAYALVHKPDVLLLDEPSSGLDPRGRAELRELVLEVSRAAGVTVFISSHELSELDRVCDRLVIIEKGRRVAEGSLDELRGRFARGEGWAPLRVLTPPSPVAETFLRGLDYVRETEHAPDGYRALVRKDALSRVAPDFVAAGVELRGFFEEAGSIEEIYLRATDGNGGNA